MNIELFKVLCWPVWLLEFSEGFVRWRDICRYILSKTKKTLADFSLGLTLGEPKFLGPIFWSLRTF